MRPAFDRNESITPARGFRLLLVIFISIAVLALTLTHLALTSQSAMRAVVNGEALWSKAQKDAVLYLDNYALSRDPAYFEKFQAALAAPRANRAARLELEKPVYNYEEVVRQLAIAGNHPDDMAGFIRLYRCCASFDRVARVVELWERGDFHIQQLSSLGAEMRAEIMSANPRPLQIAKLRSEVYEVNEILRPQETEFSLSLGQVARWLNDVLFAVTAVVIVSLMLLGWYMSAQVLRRVAESEAKYRLLLDTASDALVVVDRRSGKIVEVNREALNLTGQPEPALIGSSYEKLYEDSGQPGNGATEFAGMRELRLTRRDGRLVPIEVSASSTEWEGRPVNLAIIRDITERVRTEQQLKLAADALANVAEGVILTDRHCKIISVNKAFSRITGYQEADAIGMPVDFGVSARHDETFHRNLWEAVGQTGRWQGEIWNRHKNGEIYPTLLSVSAVCDDAGAVTHYVGVFNDISQYKAYEERLEFLAHHDALTALPNRLHFEERFHEAITRARRHGRMVGLLFLDLDGFKNVNDTYGHGIGDQLLKSIAERIRRAVRESDLVSRLGGDEFTILLDELKDENEGVRIARKLLEIVSQPALCDGHSLSVFASIGVTFYPGNGEDVQVLLTQADAAMYEAKQAGRNTYELYAPSMSAKATARLSLINGLHRACKNHDFTLAYQPVVNLATGEITGVEALLRWKHPELGDIPPTVFIPLAEEVGLIVPISEWVIETACRQAIDWERADLGPLRLAINLSAWHFRDVGLVRNVARLLQSTGWDASLLLLELTERVVMEDHQRVLQIFAELRELGMKIAIDDFGTGYSSLGYLKQFPIDYLKIDYSFISGVPHNHSDVTIVRTIIAMAKGLQLGLIAEGIERHDQRDFLLAEGCQEGQGFLFSEPLPAAEIESLLRSRKLTMTDEFAPRLSAAASL